MRRWTSMAENEWTTFGENRWTSSGQNIWPTLGERAWTIIVRKMTVLITHGPPLGHGDKTVRGEAAGCEDLLEVVERIKPRVHVFGHIHEGAGESTNGETVFINASTCDVRYQPVNRPVIYEVEV